MLGVRIKCYSSSHTGNRNKGRLCIDDIVLNTMVNKDFLTRYYEPVF